MEKKTKISLMLILVSSIVFIGVYYYVISSRIPPVYEEYGFYKGQKSYQLTLPETNGVTYYFSSSIGSDVNDGLSPSTPKKTIPSLGINLSINPGDKILLRCGDSFPSIEIHTNGNISDNIFISSYNDGGNDVILKPIITGQSGSGLLINGSNISLFDIEIRNFNYGVFLTPQSGFNNISFNYITQNVVGVFSNQSDNLYFSYNLITSQQDKTVWGMEELGAVGLIVESNYSKITKNVFLNNISPSRTSMLIGSAILLRGSNNTITENYAKSNARFVEIGFISTEVGAKISNNLFSRNILVNNQDGTLFYQYGNANNTILYENILLFDLTPAIQYGPIITLVNFTELLSNKWFNVSENLIFSTKHPAGNIAGGENDTIELFQSKNSMYYRNKAILWDKDELLSTISDSRNETYSSVDPTWGSNTVTLVDNFSSLDLEYLKQPDIILNYTIFAFYSERMI